MTDARARALLRMRNAGWLSSDVREALGSPYHHGAGTGGAR